MGTYRRAAEAVTLRAAATDLLNSDHEVSVMVLGDLNDDVDAATTQILNGPPGSEIGTGGFDEPDHGDHQRLRNLRGEGVEQQAGNGLVDDTAGHVLAALPAVLDATIHALVVGDLHAAAGVVAHRHAASAACADGQALQQRGALAGGTGGAVFTVRGGVAHHHLAPPNGCSGSTPTARTNTSTTSPPRPSRNYITITDAPHQKRRDSTQPVSGLTGTAQRN